MALSANYEIRNSYGEGIAFACQNGRPAVVLGFDGRLRTQSGEYIFVDIDDRRRDDERSTSKDMFSSMLVVDSGDSGGGMVFRTQDQNAAKLLKFISESAFLHFRVDEQYGALVKSHFRLTRDDQLGANNVLETCPVKMPKPGILTE